MRYLRPSTELRQSWQYNNQHYVVLSHIIPTLTGISSHEYGKQHIFDPLGMRQTTYNSTEAKMTGHRTNAFTKSGRNLTRCAETWAVGHGVDESCVGEVKAYEWWTASDGIYMAGPGGLVMSGHDMVSHGTPFPTHTSLPISSSRLMLTPSRAYGSRISSP